MQFNLLNEALGKAVGYNLFQSTQEKLKDMGFSTAYLWVLDTNLQAIKAYQKWGGRINPDNIKEDKIGHQFIREIMFDFQLI